MTPPLFLFEIDRGGSKIVDYRSGDFTRPCYRRLCVFNDHFLTKRIDEVFCPSGYLDAVWRLARKLYRIPNVIAPKTSVGGYHHRIVLSNLYFAKGNSNWAFIFRMFCRDEFVKYSIVEHKQQLLRITPILDAKESFARI